MASDITLYAGQPIDTDIMLYSVWISAGNPAPTVTTTDIYLSDPTILQLLAVGSVLFDVKSSKPTIYIGKPLVFGL